MLKTVISLLLGLSIGVFCRWFDVPVPSPPKLIGALLVVAMTVGYITTDKLLAAKSGGTRTTASQAQSQARN
jgi:XapX domain-containing protein